ncbi:MAG: S1C family serine protease [Candidatus Absconditabacterales bacterium]|nr:S1C family serine protease [Candidatus Absconditabacterales bacterium]
MGKNKTISIILSILLITTIVVLSFLILKVNKLQSKILFITGEDLVDITEYQKDFDFKLFEETSLKNLGELDKSIVAIYAKKNIEIVEDGEDGPQSIIETSNKLEGNGVLLTHDGYILTNKHVVQDKNAEYKIILQNQEFPVDKIRYDDGLDLAVIKIKPKDNLTASKIIKIQDKSKIGQIVFALKKDPDIGETITKMGIINSLNQKFKIDNNNIYVGLIKTSTSIEPGFSGGPLINLNGEIIAINTAIDNLEYGASYSLPINQEFINQTLSSIKQSGQIIRPEIGIKYESNPIGVRVISIEDNSNAQKAGLQINDIILGINSVEINYSNFLYELFTYNPEKQVVLNVQRGANKYEIQVNLGTKK